MVEKYWGTEVPFSDAIGIAPTTTLTVGQIAGVYAYQQIAVDVDVPTMTSWVNGSMLSLASAIRNYALAEPLYISLTWNATPNADNTAFTLSDFVIGVVFRATGIVTADQVVNSMKIVPWFNDLYSTAGMGQGTAALETWLLTTSTSELNIPLIAGILIGGGALIGIVWYLTRRKRRGSE